MQTFSPWLRPTVLGPLVTLWTLTTALHLLVGLSVLSGGLVDSWIVGMLWATFLGCTLVVNLIVSDVLLLRAKVRRLPTGARAWLSSLLAPLAVSFLWSLPILPPVESIAGLALWLMAPMALGSLGVRVVFGNRP